MFGKLISDQSTNGLRDPKIKWGLTVVLLVLALGFHCFGTLWAKPDVAHNSKIINSLDQKQDNVRNLTAAITASSIAISAIPDDTATPIAEKLMDMISYLFVSLGAIMIEKYALVLLQYIGFALLVPAGAILLLISLHFEFKNHPLWKLGIKFCLLGLIMPMIVPLSEKASGFIYDTYEVSINDTIENANEAAEAYENGKEEEDKPWYKALIDTAGNLVSTVTGAVGWAKDILNQFIEAVMVIVVTGCVIPIITVLIFILLIKWFLGFDFAFGLNGESKN